MASGSHSGDGDMVDSEQLHKSKPWRWAVRGLLLAGFGLLVAVVGLITSVWSTETGLTILAVGVVIYLIGFVVLYSGFIPAIRALPNPRPSFWKFRRILMSDALHLRY
jgi:predicted membrane channel-forming protein YqfA (hemolysin III family)